MKKKIRPKHISKWMIIFTFLTLIICACKENLYDKNNDKKLVKEYTANDTLGLHYHPLKAIKDLNGKLRNIKEKGDTAAYNELSVAYFMANELHSFYYYSLIMANKYEYRKAYLDLYLALSEPLTGQCFEELDPRTKQLAMFYLLKAYEGGELKALWDIEEKLGKVPIPPSSKYSSLN
jgi:hypothetical protein